MLLKGMSHTNKQNAQYSTGPRTPEGKAKSSLNALRHGLTGQIVVMPTDNLAAYQSHLAAFQAEYSPATPTESHLVQSLADTSWRLNRAASLESNLLALPAASHEDPLQAAIAIAAALESQAKALANLSMHSQRLSRQFERTVTQLRALQKERLATQQHDLNELLDIAEMYEEKGISFDPSEYGFVFTEAQITAAAQSRNRKIVTDEAWSYLHASA
jgi:hypothetical protein